MHSLSALAASETRFGMFHDRAYRYLTPLTVRFGPSPSCSTDGSDDQPRMLKREVSNATVEPSPTPSATIATSDMLPSTDISRYLSLFTRLRELEAPEDEHDDRIEAGAVQTARVVLCGMMMAKWSPPRMTWHIPDAVVLYWGVGDSVFAITLTEGELGYLERRGDQIVRRKDCVPVSDASCLGPVEIHRE